MGLANDLLQDYTNLTGDLDNLINGAGDLTVLEGHFTAFAGHLGTLGLAIPGLPANVPAEMKQRLETLVKQFQSYLKDAAQIAQYIQQLVSSLQVPSELKIRFEWSPNAERLERHLHRQERVDGHASRAGDRRGAAGQDQPESRAFLQCHLQPDRTSPST